MHARPNILLIMDDQHRWDWLGCSGAQWVRTPHLDALAKRGVNLNHCFTNSPLCVPARVSLATGLLPRRTGMLDNTGHLPRNLPTYYQQLRDADYRVGCVGKLHLREADDHQSAAGQSPCCYTWGFTHPEEHEGKCEAGLVSGPTGIYTHLLAQHNLLKPFTDDYIQRKRIGWPIANDDSLLPPELYQDYWTGTQAARWLQTIQDDRPWHLFASFGGPHDPFDPPAEYADRYRDAVMPEPFDDPMIDKPARVSKLHKQYPPDVVLRSRRQYAACIELIDERIGAMVEVLRHRGMLENTIILFTSDHGDMLGDHGLWRKRFFYEPALRVPLLAAGPGVHARGTCDAMIELSDVGATICDLAGLPPRPQQDAVSFAPVLAADTKDHRQSILSQIDTRQCIRTRQHKLIETPGDTLELYDLDADPQELKNLATSQPGVVEELRGLMNAREFAGQA